jgi:hypothetical protein
MSLLDKFKNLFTDEEEIEEEIPIKDNSKKEDNSLPTFMREKIEREEGIKTNINIENTSDLVRQIPKPEMTSKPEDISKTSEEYEDKNNNFKFPIAFEEKDFVETTRQSKQNVIYQEQTKKKEQEEIKKKKVSEIYGSKKEKKEVPKFKATPIISPVYGVLDKNYTKEEVKVNNIPEPLSDFEPKVQPKNTTKVDFESVRKKAYGSLTDEIRDNLMCENCELLKEARRLEKNSEQELLYDMRDDNSNQDVSLAEAEENYYDFGVSYEPTHNYEEKEEVKIVNHIDNEPASEQIEIKEPTKTQPSVLSTLKKSMGDIEESKPEKKSIEDLELTDDLFNLIDSMYDERNDD